jgi:hypothetical protein
MLDKNRSDIVVLGFLRHDAFPNYDTTDMVMLSSLDTSNIWAHGHLGAWVSDTLKDDYELVNCIKSAQAQMGYCTNNQCKVHLELIQSTPCFGV